MTTQSSTSELLRATTELFELVVHTPAVEAFLDTAAHLSTNVVTPPASCGITLRRDGSGMTVATSDALASQVDEVQYGADEGPCLDALRTGAVVQVDDLAGEVRWPSYQPHAMAHGVRSSLSIPITVDGQVRAALNLYSLKSAAFAGRERQHAEGFAGQVAATLTVLLHQAEHETLRRQLEQAVAGHTIIDQAMGILMAQQRCTAQEAFAILRGVSQHRNRKMRDIAADIIESVSGQPPQSARAFVEPPPAATG